MSGSFSFARSTRQSFFSIKKITKKRMTTKLERGWGGVSSRSWWSDHKKNFFCGFPYKFIKTKIFVFYFCYKTMSTSFTKKIFLSLFHNDYLILSCYFSSLSLCLLYFLNPELMPLICYVLFVVLPKVFGRLFAEDSLRWRLEGWRGYYLPLICERVNNPHPDQITL